MRVFGSVHTRRRFYRTVQHRWRLVTAVTSALALVAGLLIDVESHFGGWGAAPASDPGRPVAVHAVTGRKVWIPPMRPYRRPPVSWPAAQSATITVAGELARAGDTPVYVGPADVSSLRVAAAGGPERVRVSVATHQAAAALGVHGLVFALAPAAGSPGGRLRVSVDYTDFAHAYGGDYAGRLHLVELPACALSTPQLASCRTQVPVTTAVANNVRAQRAGADVTLPGTPAVSSATAGVAVLADMSSPGVVLAATAAASGDSGNFAVPPFSEASEWVHGASSGTFSYDYPVQVPPVPGGFEPAVNLDYSSQLTDGLTSAVNTQASWIGDGWDYVPGYIESDYPMCSQNGGTALAAHAGDWCTSLPANTGETPAMTPSLNGTQTPIVNGITGRAEADGGATFAYGPGGSVVMTQRDGMKYYFGLNQLPGYAAGDAVTGSQWTLPAWNPGTGSYQTVAYRLMLDYATDRNGNAIAYFYNQQSNWYAEAEGSTGTGQYTRAGTLAKITYGFQDGHAYDQAPPGEIDFTTAGGRQDVPADLACAQNAACGVTSPTFWNDQQLTAITTRSLVSGTQKPADSWALSQVFPATGDPLTGPSLWLSAITRTGQDGTTPVTLPPTQFAPAAAAMPNRVMTPADTTAGYSPISRFRLGAITSPAGGVTTIRYTPADPACAAGNFPAPDANATQCYPDSWLPSGAGSPVMDWWNVYAVATRTVTDTTGGDPPVVTSYTYAGPGWHYDNDTVSRSVTQTFDGWRGFRTVTTQAGTAPDPVTQTTDTYYQGLSRNCAASSCPKGTPVTLTSSHGTTADDNNGFAGMVFEEITYDGAGTGNEVTDSIHNAGILTTTATGTGAWAGVTANITGDNGIATYTALAGGGARESMTSYTYDRNGLLTQQVDQPDVSDPSQWTCTTKSYGAFDLLAGQDTFSYVSINGHQTCATLASGATITQMQAAAVSAVSDTYDPAGNLTQVQKGTGIVPAGTGPCPPDTLQNPHVACWTWQTTQTSTYDSYGRVLTQADADNRKTTTTYTPAAGAEPTSVQVTDPMSLSATTTYDPARDLPLTVTDPAGYQTVKAYDALGRITSEWTPGNPASGPAVSTYSYTDSASAPSYSTEQTETPNGGYLTTVTISDSLGQVREVQQQTASGGSDIADVAYNSDGWKALTSSPYYSSSAPSGALVSASSPPAQTGYAYDGAGRVVKEIAYKNGTETWETDTTYGGNYTTVVPPSGGTSQTTFTDGRGLTTAIYQYHAGVPADPSDPAADYDKTTYTYAPGKQLAGIADAAGNSWSYSYDLLGREISQSDPDAGTTTSSYDPAGQLMSVTDARGKTVSYTYDSDGRKTAEYDKTGGALESPADQLASWTYDTVAKGRPTASTSFSNGAQYVQQVTGYNAQGLPSGTSVVIPSAAGKLAGTYTQQYTYAPDGVQISYADSADGGLPSETVTTGYDSAGNASSFTGTATYVAGLSYTTLGQPLQYTMGTTGQPVWITDSYDPQTGRPVEQITQTGTGQASVDDLHYTYDPSGNVTSEADTPAGALSATDVQCFQNDYLGRLVQAWAQAATGCAATPSAGVEGGAAPYWNSYAYNAIGSLTSMTSTTPTGAVTTSGFTYPAAGSAQPHAVASQSVAGPSGTTSTSYGYDKAGNLTSVTGPAQAQSLTWSTQGKLAQDSVTPSGSGTAQNSGYTYDAGGNLLLETDPGTTTLYLGDEELSLSTGSGAVTATRYYELGGVTVATRSSGGSVAYLAADTQGTSSVAIDAATLNITRRWYDPYGNPRGNVPASFPAGQKGFIGGTVSTATGLTSLGAREYQPATGSFVSTDSVLNPYDPADLNPYAYAQGNPATLSDPSGLCPSADCAGAHDAPPVQQNGIPCGTAGGPACNPDQVCDASHPDVCAYHNDKTHCFSDYWDVFHACQVKHEPRGTTSHKPAHHRRCAVSVFGACVPSGGVISRIAGGVSSLISSGVSTVIGALGGGISALGSPVTCAVIIEVCAEVSAGVAISSAITGSSACAGGQSFTPDTKVVLASGKSIPISQLKPGDKVLATNTKTGKTQPETVTAVMVRHDTNLYNLRIKAGSRTAVIHTTRDHLFWDATIHRWVSAAKLIPGDRLSTLNHNTVVVMGGDSSTQPAGWMWDLTVPGNNDHDFYVSSLVPILVHNVPMPRVPNWQDYCNEDNDEPTQEPMKPRASGSSNQAENRYTDYLAQKYHLNAEQARELHDEITGKHLTKEEIEKEAESIAEGK